MGNSSKVIVAFDVSNYAAAMKLARRMDPSKYRAAKVGKELFTAAGPNVVLDLMRMGIDVFLDLKYHDIPNTVAGAVRAACGLGVWMLNVHALGGRAMMEAAANEIAKIPADKRPLGVGVTLLTSMGQVGMDQVGLGGDPAACVLRLAGLAKVAGLDGVVCSSQEASVLRNDMGKEFVLVTPGIRLPEGNVNDQERVGTPEFAIESGVHYLVIGRPVTQAESPNDALEEFNRRVLSVQQL